MLPNKKNEREREREFYFMPAKSKCGHMVASSENNILLHLRDESNV